MAKADFEGRFLGVLGGMGPLAGATFMTRLTLLTPAQRDQDHIPAILWSDPRIPGRPAAFLEQGEDPLPWMANGIKHLEAAGAKAVVIPCNTAHLWYEPLTQCSSVPILHIVEAVIANLRQQGVKQAKVGLLATAATLHFQLYQPLLAEQGYEVIELDADDLASYCTSAIELVKQNKLEQAQQSLTPAINLLHERGAQAVILGCTELPLALPLEQRGQWPIPIVDSVDALALAAIRWWSE